MFCLSTSPPFCFPPRVGYIRPVSLPCFIRPHARGALLDILVAPRASRDKIVGKHGDRLKVAIAAAPTDGEANQALIEFLAGELGMAKQALSIVSGMQSKRKTVLIEGGAPDQVSLKLTRPNWL